MSYVSIQSLGPASSSGGGTSPEEEGGPFVHFKWQSETKTAERPPRLYHKKSRNGCQHCRARRVKCDEVHPVCGGCVRHHIACAYRQPAQEKIAPCLASNGNPGRTPRSKANNTISSSKDSLDESPVATRRRLLELELLHQYMYDTSRTLSIRAPGPAEQMLREIWISGVPRLAFKSESLLCSLCCVASMHLAKLDRQNSEALEASKTYFGHTIRMHGEEVAQLNEDNADAAFVTSCIIRVLVFAMLQERELKPYTPPTQWLSMTNMGWAVFRAAWPIVKDNPNSLARALMISNRPEWSDNMAVFRDQGPWRLESVFGEQNRQNMAHLLARTEANEKNELWSSEIRDTYEMATGMIGGAFLAVKANKDPGDILRLLVLFPIVVEKLFLDMVTEQQPRALVVLAHYFALLARYREVWWIGDTGQREIHAIQSVLPAEWQELLSWPLQAMNEEPLHAG